MEKTLILIKPDGVKRGLMGEVLRRIERKGYLIEDMKMVQATEEQLRAHYKDLVDKSFFPGVLNYMMSGKLVAIIAKGENVVAAFRQIAGGTKPTEALPGTIRGDFGRDWSTPNVKNIVHGSDSPDNAQREIAIWFE